METKHALPILRALAYGVDPETGEVFPKSSPYQRADTVRALYAAMFALEAQEKAERRKRVAPANSGKPWSEDEDRRMLGQFDAGRGISEIVRLLERTEAGVRARLVKYGRLAA